MGRNTRRASTRYLAISAVLCALGVILLAVGALFQVLDLSMAVIASFAVILAVIELGGSYPFLIYLVTSVLSLLLVPVKTAPLAYVCFAGFYPMLKAVFERKLARLPCIIVKILVFNVCFALVLFAMLHLFTVLVLDNTRTVLIS